MRIRLNFTETTHRSVVIETASVEAAVEIWGNQEADAFDWIDEASERDGGILWDSATFTPLKARADGGV